MHIDDAEFYLSSVVLETVKIKGISTFLCSRKHKERLLSISNPLHLVYL